MNRHKISPQSQWVDRISQLHNGMAQVNMSSGTVGVAITKHASANHIKSGKSIPHKQQRADLHTSPLRVQKYLSNQVQAFNEWSFAGSILNIRGFNILILPTLVRCSHCTMILDQQTKKGKHITFHSFEQDRSHKVDKID